MVATSKSASDGENRESYIGKCQALIDAATSDIFLNNVFRITGLSVDATTRDIVKQITQRKLRAELGEADVARSSPFVRESLPSLEEVRNAERKLRNPEKRVVDELFWFWPIDSRGSKLDPALHALGAGDFSTAEQLWKTLESSPDKGAIAIHNLAVRWHLTALSLERHWNSTKADEKARETLTKCWMYALKRWGQLINDAIFWEVMTARVKTLDDPRVTTSFVKGMRATLPMALASINVALIVEHVENDENALVIMHVRLIRDSHLVLMGPDEFTSMVLAKAKERIRHHVQCAQQHLQSSPATSIEAAKELVKQLARYATLFSVLNLKENTAANDILDEGAEVCMYCAIRANEHTHDDATFVDVFGRILEIARSSATRERAQKNLDAGHSDLLSVTLDPVYKALLSVKDSNESPISRLAGFEKNVAPLLSKVLTDLPTSEIAHSALSDAAAQVLRGISIDAWNKSSDSDTATAAIKGAMKYAIGDEIKSKLYDDFTTLVRLIQERKTIERKKKFKVLAWIIGGFLFLLLVSRVFNGPDVPSQSVNGAAQINTSPEPSVNDGDHSQRTYLVPSDDSAELESDSAAIEIQKNLALQLENQYKEVKSALADQDARADALEHQLDLLKAQIDQERPFADNGDAIASFNNLVTRYNSLLRQAREQRNRANALVDQFNAMVGKVNAQNYLVNQMVDAYNEKLRRLGH